MKHHPIRQRRCQRSGRYGAYERSSRKSFRRQSLGPQVLPQHRSKIASTCRASQQLNSSSVHAVSGGGYSGQGTVVRRLAWTAVLGLGSLASLASLARNACGDGITARAAFMVNCELSDRIVTVVHFVYTVIAVLSSKRIAGTPRSVKCSCGSTCRPPGPASAWYRAWGFSHEGALVTFSWRLGHGEAAAIVHRPYWATVSLALPGRRSRPFSTPGGDSQVEYACFSGRPASSSVA